MALRLLLMKQELALDNPEKFGLMNIGTCKITMEVLQILLPSEAKLELAVTSPTTISESHQNAQNSSKLSTWSS